MGEAKRRRDAGARAQAEWEASGRRYGDAPVEAEYHAQMAAVIQAIDELFNGKALGAERKVGVVLMTFGINQGPHGGRCNYMSNGVSREDIVSLMKEMIARFEGQAEPGAGRA